MSSNIVYSLFWLIFGVSSFFLWRKNKDKDLLWFMGFGAVGFIGELINYYLIAINSSQDILSTVGSVATATWKGVSLTKVTSTREIGMAAEMWYLASPSVGSGTISVTVTGATDAIKLGVEAFTGTATSSVVDVQKAAIGVSGNPTISATTNTASDLVLATLSRYSTTAATTNRTSIYNDTTGSTLAAASYQLASSTGSYSDTYTGSVSQDWAMIMVGFKPGTTSGGGGGTGSSTINYVLTDQLGGTNVITSSGGGVLNETIDTFPFGAIRIDTLASGVTTERFKFAKTMADALSSYNYAQTRYENPSQGQFISEDPVFLEVPMAQNIANPQSLNAYAYAQDNPITGEDPTGKALSDFQTINTNPSLVGQKVGSYEGVVIYYNDHDTGPYQCTQFVNQYIRQQYGLQPTGSGIANASEFNAATLNAAYGTNGFTTSQNGASGNSLPTEDSVITFGPGSTAATQPGHVAIIGAVNFNPNTKKGTVTIAQQNTDPRVFEEPLPLTQNSNGGYVVGGFSGMSVTGWTSYGKAAPASPSANTQGTSSGGGAGNFGFLSSILQTLSQTLTALSKLL